LGAAGEEDGPERMPGRKRFEEVVSVRLAGPETVRPREPNTEGKRMRVLVTEGVAHHRESIKDVFQNPYSFVSDVIGE